PVLLQQMLEMHRLHAALERILQLLDPVRIAPHRRPHPLRYRRRAQAHFAPLDPRAADARFDLQISHLETRALGIARHRGEERPAPGAHQAASSSITPGLSATAARIAPRSRSPSQSSERPAITLSTSSRFDSSSWSIRSSSVPVEISECTYTGLCCPSRCARSV